MRLLLGGGFREAWRRSAEPDRCRKEYSTRAADAGDGHVQIAAGRGGKLRSSSSFHPAATKRIPNRVGLHPVRAGATARNEPPDRHSKDDRRCRLSAAFFFLPGQMPFDSPPVHG